MVTDQSFCTQGTTLAVVSISKPFAKPEPDKVHVRDVEIEVTASSRDLRPMLRLEGERYDLSLVGQKWKGTYRDVRIVGSLQVLFNSLGYLDQVFELKVVVKKEGDTSKDKTKTFHIAILGQDPRFDS
jgi:hypothetical protein